MKKAYPILIIKKALSPGLGVFVLSVITGLPASAQDVSKPEGISDLDILISNPLFLSLSFTIVALLIIIYSLKGILSSLAAYKLTEIKAEKAKKLGALFVLILLSSPAFSQDVVKTGDAGIGGLPSPLVYGMLFLIVTELIVVGLLLHTIRIIIKGSIPVVEEQAKPETNFLDSFNASVPVEDEEAILMEHDYDGIRELDNNLPPWWKYGFYFTIVFSIVYLIYYHMGGGGLSSLEEYNQQLAEAKIQIEEYRKRAGNLIDETNVKMLSGADDIASGKEIYDLNCSACHGKLGEGGIGPNLTDDYWLHGGSIKDVFKTIKYGYAEKGMKAWEADLSPLQINQVASYIKSLRGTNPPNAKEKQGELYVEPSPVAEDLKAESPDLSRSATN